jgi:hypothetical protein
MIILTDCDGVLLNWAQSYHWWMHRKGYRPKNPDEYAMDKCYGIPRDESKELCRTFCESAAVGFLPPMRDAVKYVRKLHEEHGAVFHCITSMSNDPWAYKLREQNLNRIFGEGVFERLVCLDCGADKDEALERYRDSDFVWVEDKPENAELGAKMGLNSFLLTHDYNRNHELKDGVIRVNNWKELYEYIGYLG